MAKLVWEKFGDRRFEAGVDRGVLYLPSGKGIAWSGLTAVDEQDGNVTAPLYMDGAKYFDKQTFDEYSANLKVITYPDEFLQFDGVVQIGKGLFVEDQIPAKFGLSYRVSVGNDTEGLGYGYRIHLVYNLTAIPDAVSYATIGKDIDPVDFSWNISGIPERVTGFRATAHAIIDTRLINKYMLQDLYNIIYGTDTVDPRLPSLDELTTYVNNWQLITFVDNGDGSWTATGPDEYFTVNNTTGAFQITNVNVVYLDADTYQAQDTKY